MALCRLAGLTAKDFDGKNIVFFMTDQERAIQHFPKGWDVENLPGLTRLKKNGVTFKKAFTNACMCSPARSTLLSGFLPAQHGVYYTLEEGMPNTTYPQVELPKPDQLPNMLTLAAAAGYTVVYKGKFHAVKPANASGTWAPSDVGQYGGSRWNPKVRMPPPPPSRLGFFYHRPCPALERAHERPSCCRTRGPTRACGRAVAALTPVATTTTAS